MNHLQENQLFISMQKDNVYQQLLQECTVAEAEFLRIKNGLSPEDQEKLETYISLCEELEHREAYLARRIQ